MTIRIAALSPHPETPCDVLAAAEIEAERLGDGGLWLRWRLSGIAAGLVWPEPSEGRTDFLWRRTCFEAFIQAPPDGSYRELNLGGGAWAAYQFAGYRTGMGDAEIGPPELNLSVKADQAWVEASWRLDLPPEAHWRLGGTMIIEAADGRLSYWAITHPCERPEFHDARGWTLDMPAPG